MDGVAFNGSHLRSVTIPISPRWLEIVTACWLAFLLAVGLLFNSAILAIFVRLRLISAFYNVLISALLVNNLSIALLAFPFSIVAELSGGWLVNLKSGSCDYYAFVVYFLGMSSMFLHTAISLTRYYVVARSRSIARKITVYVTCWIVACCYCMSLVLALAPVFGLGSYGLEEHGTSCGLAWDDTRLVNKIYLLLILVATFVIPMIVMVFCYGSIYRTVKNSSVATESQTSNRFVAQQRRERHIQKLSVLMVVVFITSWTPYTFVSFYQAFGPGTRLSPILTRVPAVVAKTCVVWDPIIYALLTSNFRKQARCLFRSGRAILPDSQDINGQDVPPSGGAPIPLSDVQP